jgi:hypothetical protein
MIDELDELEELEDFDLPPISYEVWVLGHTRFDVLTNFEFLVGSFTNPDAAVDRAKNLTVPDITKENDIPDGVSYFSIEVETVAADTNAGTIYKRCLENTKPAVDLWIKETDYELTEEGNLRIVCSKIKPFKVGDYLNISISSRPETEPILLRVMLKVADSITCEFID